MNTRSTIISLVAVVALIALVVLTPHTSQIAKLPATTAVFSCANGRGLTAAFFLGSSTPAKSPGQPPTPGGSVALSLSDGRTMTLPQTISADGGRYANADESFVFWGKGNGALILEGGKETNYVGCIVVAQATAALPISYSNSTDRFSIRLPAGYQLDEQYRYTERGPGKDIAGIKFTIASTTAAGSNLSADSYLSVEGVPLATSTQKVSECSASIFLDGVKPQMVQDGTMTYSFGATMGAGAGNRYEEAVFALPGTNPCIGVRYFIHYGVFENYPAGSVKQFDEKALIAQFDAIRHTLILAQ